MFTLLVVTAQTIFPPVVEGQVGDSVSIMCVAAVSNLQNALEIRTPGSTVFVNYETTADADTRLARVDSDVNSTLTSYTLGPLRLEDNGAVFRCSPQAGADTTSLNVLCKYFTHEFYYEASSHIYALYIVISKYMYFGFICSVPSDVE